MKNKIRFLVLIVFIYMPATMSLPKSAHTMTDNNSCEMYQTWEEFLESGVQLQYDETPVITEDINH